MKKFYFLPSVILTICLCSTHLFSQVKITVQPETTYTSSNLQLVQDGDNELGLISYEYVVLDGVGTKMSLLYLPKEDRSIDFSKAYVLGENAIINFDETSGLASKLTDTRPSDAIYLTKEGRLSKEVIADAQSVVLKPYLLEDKRGEELETYPLVKIGKQIWMRSNLRTKLFNDGTAIAFLPEKKAWMETKSPAVTYYDGKEDNRAKLGALYNWFAVTTKDKFAPLSWKVPTQGDWEALAKYIDPKGAMSYDMATSSLSYKAGELIKSETEWRKATNPTGGDQVLSGNNKTMLDLKGYGSTSTSKYFDGYSGMSRQGYFWTSTQSDYEQSKGMFIRLFWDSQTINCSFEDKFMGYSVRCIADKGFVLKELVAVNKEEAKIVNKAGALSSKLSDEQKKEVMTIEISGSMDARDFKTLREMSKLKKVTLDNVKILAYRGDKGTLKGVKRYFANEVPRESFKACTQLQSFKAIGNITSLGANCFEGCSSLSEVLLPNTLTEMGGSNFLNCKALRTLVLPSGFSDLGMATFKGCSLLTSINLPSSISSIDMEVFMNCSSLATLVLPKDLESIGMSAFEGCSSIKEVIIPEKIETLEMFSFAKCSSLKKVVLNEALTSIDYGAFLENSVLETIVLPSKLETIGAFAFQGCKGLKELTLPKSLVAIKNGAFKETAINFTLPEGSNFKLEGKLLMSADGKVVHNLTTLFAGKIIVPEGVELIAGAAFSGCNGLMKIDLPSTLKEIKLIAMENTALYEIVLRVKDPSTIKLGEDVFGKMDQSRCSLFVEDASLEQYKTAAVWKNFNVKPLSSITGIVELGASSLQVFFKGDDLYCFNPHFKGGQAFLEIFDLRGRKLYERKMTSSEQSFCLKDLVQGVYIVRIGNISIRVLKK